MTVALDVRDFGFQPGVTADAGPALRSALQAARGGGARLELVAGDYHVWPETSVHRELFVSNTVGTDPRFATKSLGLLLDGMEDLVVTAPGARLLVHGRQTALAVIDSRRVVIDGLEIDWAVPTVVDVTVVEAGADADGGWRLLTVPACTRFRVDGTDIVWLSERSPSTGTHYWSGRNALAYSQTCNLATGRVRRARCPLFDDVARIEVIDDRTMRVSYLTSSVPEDRGLVYQLRETDRDHPGMLVLDSAEVAMRRMRIRYLHGFGLVAQNSRDLTLDRVVFRPPEGTGRVTAGFADFVQCSGTQGRVDIRDCEFDGPHDDAINIHGTYLAVTDAADRNAIDLAYMHGETAGFPQFSPGDEIELVERRTLRPVHATTVAEATGPTGRDSASLAAPMRARLVDALPAAVLAQARAGVLAAENTTRTPEVTIDGCRFRRIPTRAVLVTTRRPVRISGCRFEGIAMPCIQIAADATGWWESGPVRDVRVEGNTFRDVVSGVMEVAPGVACDAPPVHDSVRFERNEVELAEVLLADLRGLRSFVARDNAVRWSTGAAVSHDAPVIRAAAAVHVEWHAGDASPLRPLVRHPS